MKSVKQLEYYKNIRQVSEFDFGTFYIFEGIVISEMNEGVIFNWKMADWAIKSARNVLGNDKPIAYISNRINTYFPVPSDWLKFYKNRNDLKYYAVVGNKTNVLSVILERIFFRNHIKKFTDIEQAISWCIESLKNEK